MKYRVTYKPQVVRPWMVQAKAFGYWFDSMSCRRKQDAVRIAKHCSTGVVWESGHDLKKELQLCLKKLEALESRVSVDTWNKAMIQAQDE